MRGAWLRIDLHSAVFAEVASLVLAEETDAQVTMGGLVVFKIENLSWRNDGSLSIRTADGLDIGFGPDDFGEFYVLTRPPRVRRFTYDDLGEDN